MRGIVGQKEWRNFRIFNALRIVGLETQPTLLLLTRSGLHLFNDFVCNCKSGDVHLNANGLFDADVLISLLPLQSSSSTDTRTLFSKVLVEMLRSDNGKYTNCIVYLYRLSLIPIHSPAAT
jgi:hypothetical protein